MLEALELRTRSSRPACRVRKRSIELSHPESAGIVDEVKFILNLDVFKGAEEAEEDDDAPPAWSNSAAFKR